MNLIYDIIFFAIPLLLAVFVLLIRHSVAINSKKIFASLGIISAGFILYELLCYFSRFVIGSTNNSFMLIAIMMLIDVLFQSIIIFAEAMFLRKLFMPSGKIHFMTYIILTICIIISAALYYADYAETFTALANGIDDSSFLNLITMQMPRYTIVRKILYLIPAAVIIIPKFSSKD